jgi:FtsP/CotA-like multicopper oxidase with cupredoxin domain
VATNGPFSPKHRLALRLLQAAGVLAALMGVAGLAWAGWSWWNSRLPGSYSVMDFGTVEYGGGKALAAAHDHTAHSGTSVTLIRGAKEGKPNFRATLTAQQTELRLASGNTVDALTFNGRAPGPELRVRRGDLVEITLFNRDVEDGVSIHWHGVDVPGGEDGVSGVTQDRVLPGKRFTYRFRAEQVGTFWYHSHQASAKNIPRGLFGVLVVEPRRAGAPGLDLAAVAHNFSGIDVLGASDRSVRRAVSAGTPVTLRLVNSDSFTRRFAVAGTPFRVVAIDGTDLAGPTPLERRTLELGAGGRYDVAFTMPATPVKLELLETPLSWTFSRDGRQDLAASGEGPEFDPLGYGRPEPSGDLGPDSRFDRSFDVKIDRKLGFRDGGFGFQWTVNGKIHPDTPVFLVRKGERVKMTITSSTSGAHPMHLHGHHWLVLSRDGILARGSPWWADTLNLEQGDSYEVAFRADTPGVWMFHCHILQHADEGLDMHLMYEGVSTPFEIGKEAGNDPE